MVFRIIFFKFIIPTRHNNRRHKIIIYNTQNAGWPSSYIRGQPRIDQTESKSRAQPRASASATKLRISESIALKSLKLEMSAYICIRSTTRRDVWCCMYVMWRHVTAHLHPPPPPPPSLSSNTFRCWGRKTRQALGMSTLPLLLLTKMRKGSDARRRAAAAAGAAKHHEPSDD